VRFSFSFTSTHRDLLDAFDAERTARTGMRSWARGALAALGLMWLLGFVWAVSGRQEVRSPWLPLIWLIFGATLTWKLIVQPLLTARTIRRETPPEQQVMLTFGDAGIDVTAADHFHRAWNELAVMHPAGKGIIFGFQDGMLHWLPNRAFANPTERDALIEYVAAKLEELPVVDGD
jgi:hypothetical protein